jgi:hypothetical protein
VVVVHDGRLMAERYAEGISADTPLVGWSMTKSVVNALVGILVKTARPRSIGPCLSPRGKARTMHVTRLRSIICFACRAGCGSTRVPPIP